MATTLPMVAVSGPFHANALSSLADGETDVYTK